MSLRGHRVAVTDRGILVIGCENLDVIPLGQLLCELTPGLLVPLGMDIVPRVTPEVLARALGHRPGVVTVFTDRRPAVPDPRGRVPDARAPLAREDGGRQAPRPSTTPPSRPPEAQIVNDAVGRFALWGFPDAPDRKLLPSGDDK